MRSGPPQVGAEDSLARAAGPARLSGGLRLVWGGAAPPKRRQSRHAAPSASLFGLDSRRVLWRLPQHAPCLGGAAPPKRRQSRHAAPSASLFGLDSRRVL